MSILEILKRFLTNLFHSLSTMFQDAATPVMEGIHDLHNHVMFYLIMILVFVLYIVYRIRCDFYLPFFQPKNEDDLNFRKILLEARKIVHGTWIEIIWTIIPSVILLFIAVPSFALLYAMDEVIDPTITLKAIGHQWYLVL